MSIYVGTPSGSATQLDELDVSELFPGARITALGTEDTYVLTESDEALDPGVVEAVAGQDNLRWVLAVDGGGGGALNVAFVEPADSPYTLPADVDVVACLVDDSDISILLPEADSNNVGRQVTIKYASEDDPGTVTITADDCAIDGEGTVTLDQLYQSLTIISDGNNWMVQNPVTVPGASVVASIVFADSPYTIPAGVDVVICNTSGGETEVVIPDPVDNAGRKITIKNSAYQAANTIDINPSPVDGIVEPGIQSSNGAFATIISDGVRWHVISGAVFDND